MNTNRKYKGVIVPMVTPLDENLKIDHAAVEKLTDSLVRNHAIPFILGTTGEAPSMSGTLKEDLVKSVIQVVKGRSPVFAGVSSNSLQDSVNLSRKFADIGIEAVIATLPSYYPMNDDQIIVYIEKLADQLPVPLILYNIPVTVGFSIPLEIIDKMSHHPNIAGIKDSERDIERLDRSLMLWSEREDFSFWLGWAHMSVYGIQNGADGIVPSTANLVPNLFDELYRSVTQGRMDKAEELQEKTDEISGLYQKGRKLNQSIPALKVLLSILGLCEPIVLPPLFRLEEKEERNYIEKMKVEFNRMLV